ncbi:hypothetical protein vseg_006223 [Gypsophila vaccaria]
MKGNRVEAADEWVNGSWTVDCICGVTFDDGEEMVNCDECGVWVHTRCSRYVKGDKSFACDKCKSRRRRRRMTMTMSEETTETEVAQLLAELPTKTLHHHTLRPLHDRVHVQGVPGGPSSLFPSSSILSPQLWKSSGYIPKHFNFRYSDFPSSISFPSPSVALPTSPLANAATSSDDNPALHPPPSAITLLPSVPSPSPDTHVPALKPQGLVQAVDEILLAHPEIPPSTNVMPKSKLLIDDLTNSASKRKHIEILRNLDAVSPPRTDDYCNLTKLDGLIDNPKGALSSDPAGIDIKSDSIESLREHVLSPVQVTGSKLIESEPNISKPPLEQAWKDIDNGSEAVAGGQFERNYDMTDIETNAKLECSSVQVPSFLRGSKESARPAGQTPQVSGAVAASPLSHNKMASAEQTSSISPAIVFSRSHLSNKSRSGGSQNPSLVGKRLVSNSYVNNNNNNNKEYAPVDLAKNEDKHDKTTSVLKDNPKPCTPTLKPSQPSTGPKYYASVGKDLLKHSSSKSSVDGSSVSSTVGEPAGTFQSEHGLHGQNKNIASVDRQRGEKDPQSNFQLSSKSNQSSTGHPTASSISPAGLSDEELALLLHQELNSSPRVPRVPRVRHAGSLPQLSSSTGLLMKRSSTSGGKDKNTFSRRKSRDAPKDGSRSSRGQDSEACKVDGIPSSPDSLQKTDTFTLAEVNTDPKSKKNSDKISSSPANSGPFSTDAVEFKSSSVGADIPENEAGANKNCDPTYRTLPGLIAEIMGTGRRMTYEELCNAVLPHWSNLRKHNGERYAYSSHSQAVLDCLRNRTEWARLVDRGPKTSSSRKKRKIDAEPLSSESEDGEDRNPKDGENKSFESNKEDFPKGRRKARKRRRAAPPGRSVKDGQKKRKIEPGSSCDSGSFSNSSEDSVSSQDDCGGSEMDVAKTEVSASSLEVRAM